MAIQKFGVYAKASRFSNETFKTANENAFDQNEFWETFAQNAFSANTQTPHPTQNASGDNVFSHQDSSTANTESQTAGAEEEQKSPSPPPKKKNGVFAAYVAAHNARAAKIR